MLTQQAVGSSAHGLQVKRVTNEVVGVVGGVPGSMVGARAKLVASMPEREVVKTGTLDLVTQQPREAMDSIRRIAEQTGAKLIKLPIMPGGVPKTATYIEMMDFIVQSFVDAAPKK